MKRSIRWKNVLLAVALFLVVDGCLRFAMADVVYFKDGRKWEGLILEQDTRRIRLDMGFDIARLDRMKIRKITPSSPGEARQLRVYLEQKRKRARILKEKAEYAPKAVKLRESGGHLFVDAVINGRAATRLLIDTGSSVIVFSKETAKRLGIDVSRSHPITSLKLADGRKIRAAVIKLKSVAIQNVSAEDVQAAVLLDNSKNLNLPNGLLGMSFLKRFNFKIDYRTYTMTLEKLKNPSKKSG